MFYSICSAVVPFGLPVRCDFSISITFEATSNKSKICLPRYLKDTEVSTYFRLFICAFYITKWVHYVIRHDTSVTANNSLENAFLIASKHKNSPAHENLISGIRDLIEWDGMNPLTLLISYSLPTIRNDDFLHRFTNFRIQ